MAGDRWNETTLGAIAERGGYGLVDGPFGSNLPASAYTDDGVPVIRGSNLSLGTSRFNDSEFVFVSEEMAQRLSRSLCRAGDIVFTKKGTLGQTGLIPQHSRHRQFLLSSNQMKLSVDRKAADPLFVYYYVSSPEAREKIIRDSEITGVPKTNTAYLRQFPIFLPPLDQQKAIAHILGTLDDKIELNRRMNETLEAMARAIFKSWFVDFLPVRAKAAARTQTGDPVRLPAEGSAQVGAPGLPKHIADLFPDRFEDSELGEIPAGWKIGNVGEFASLSRNGTDPGDFPDETFEHFSIPAFDEGQTPKPELGGSIKSNKYLIPPDAILLSKLNPRIPRLWLPVVRDNPRAICSTEFLVVSPRAEASREFIYGFLSSEIFADVFETLVTGTSGSHQRVKPEGLLSMNVVIPGKSVIHHFSKIVQPLLACMDRTRAESQSLAASRDTLLPKLISGDLRVDRSELDRN